MVAGRVCTKQCGRLDRWQGPVALASGEADAMRRVQAPIRGCVELPINHPGLTGILLVGGASTRFGSPKALARLGGRTLAEIGWETLAFCDERIAVGKTADRLDLPFDLLDDNASVRAPIVGVAAGLRSAQHDLCVVLPVDTPCIASVTLRELAASCTGDVVVPQTGPLPGVYRKSALAALEQALAAGALSLWDAIADLDVTRVEVDPALLINVNRPDDLV